MKHLLDAFISQFNEDDITHLRKQHPGTSVGEMSARDVIAAYDFLHCKNIMTPTPTTTQAQHMAHFNRLLEQFDDCTAYRFDRITDYFALSQFIDAKWGVFSPMSYEFKYVALELGYLTPEQAKAE